MVFAPNDEPVKETSSSQTNLNTSTHQPSDSTSQLRKTFSYLSDKISDAKENESTPEDTGEEDKDEEETSDKVDAPAAKVAPPDNPYNGNNGYTTKRIVSQIDKSKSSLSAKQSNGSGGGLQLTPTYPTYPTAPNGNPSSNSFFNTQEDEGNNQGIASMLNTNKTQNAVAAVLFNRDYLLAKGAFIDCVLNTSMNSTLAGMTKCTLTRHIYSDNGNTLLLERGSEVTGEYRANIAQGQARLFVLWDRVKTPYGVVVDLASPATDSLGSGGVDGYVDTHFWERFGGAMMLSLVDDLAGYVATSGGKSVNNFESSSDAAQNMAAEALKNTINIPPTFHKNQGERIGIFIARDIDFSKVYQLKAR
ncbi:type IV secretion system protein VirB10 [Aliivibrio salmonicida]|uniref:type IV secretion system protein VirB10 n=1 Tax=Aliivibrio salmonicida TaxID=40269 RepID=UPI00406CB109